MKYRRVDDRVAVPSALSAGVVAAFGGASPTGSVWSDALVVTCAVAVVTWAGASVPWWAAAGCAGVAAALAGSWLLAAVGSVGFVVGLWVGLQRRELPLARAAVVGLAMNVLIRSTLDGFLGATAAVGVALGAAIVVLGVRRRQTSVRRRVMVGAAVVGAGVVVALGGLVVAAVLARDGLTEGSRLARAGIELVSDGDYVEAAERFDDAAAAFTDADGQLGAAWAVPSSLVPVVAQNRAAAVELADAAAAVSRELADALLLVDPDQLGLVGGRFDLAAIESVQQPFTEVQSSLRALQDTVASSRSPWLVAPIDDRLDDLAEELADNEERLDNAVRAVRLAPRLLGGEGARRYFVAFTTPAEARGLGGFMGNWAEITAEEGRLVLTGFGRTRDLNQGGTDPRFVTGPDDWVAQWGRFGFTNGPGGATGDVPWSNITASPQFPSTAQVIAELYPQSGGRELDGVFAVDPFVIEALLGFTGPVRIDGTDQRLTRADVVQFLLVDQYAIDDDADRVDLLEEVSRAVLEQLLAGALPDPTEVAADLGPLVSEGRLLGWAREPEEQELFESVRMDGALPGLDGGDGIAAVFNNAGANKLDVYLDVDVVYEAVVEEASGRVESVAEVTLTNTLSEGGSVTRLPSAVTGNYTGDRRGTNRTLLSVYSALPVVRTTIGGETVRTDVGSEAGWVVNSAFVAVAPGESVTVRLEMVGSLDGPSGGGGYSLAVRPQPMVVPQEMSLRVASAGGDVLIDRSGVVAEREIVHSHERAR